MMDTVTLSRMADTLEHDALRAAEFLPRNHPAWDTYARALKVADALRALKMAERAARIAARDTRPESVRGFDRGEARREAREASAARADLWVTGCNGDEEPTLRAGGWSLYQYNYARASHRWLNLETLTAERAD